MSVQAAYKKAVGGIRGRLDGHYQHDGVKWMLSREFGDDVKGGILADDMGLGKTMQAIACMRGNELPTLIVTIVGTVNQWRDALIEFGGYKPVIINPSFTGILPSGVDVAVTTYSAFQRSVPPKCLFAYGWGRVILDEGHTIRNPATRVHKELSRLGGVGVKWILSGTPIQNSQKDLITLGGWIGAKGMDIEQMVDTLVLRRTQEEQAVVNPRLALPPLTSQVIKLEFADEGEREFYESIEEYYSHNATTNFEAMEALTRCRQVCTNVHLYMESMEAKKKKRKVNDGPPMPVEAFKSTKLQWLVRDISQSTKKCLVFCMWTLEMKMLQKELEEVGISSLIYDGHLSRDAKESVLYNFKNTEIPCLIIQINCGSSGLNLQCANRVYITSPNWNPCVELQAIGRAYRKGQTECVTCVRLVMAGTIEERCMGIQEAKMGMISEAMKDDSLEARLGGFGEDDDSIDIRDFFRKTDVDTNKKQAIEVPEPIGGDVEVPVQEALPVQEAAVEVPMPVEGQGMSVEEVIPDIMSDLDEVLRGSIDVNIDALLNELFPLDDFVST